MTASVRTRRLSWELFALLAIMAAGAALRFAALGEAPPGLYHDEAVNGLDALDVLAGARPLYFEANNGREPLFIYLVAWSVGLFGREPFAVRLPAALLGTLTIPAAYAMARAWFPGRRAVPLATAALVAFTFWPLHLSRIGFRVVSLPLVAALLLAALGWWLHPVHRKPAAYARPALAGALLGLSMYTYLAARFIPVTLAVLALWGWRTRTLRATWREGLAFLLAAALVLAPLAIYTAAHFDVVFGRSGQVSVFSPDINQGDLPGALVRHTLAGLGLFFVRGDGIARHNLPGRPVFDALMAVFFIVGLAWCAARARREPGAALALIWTAVMLVPTILAEDTPHFLRAGGLLPVACLFPAAGLDVAATLLRTDQRLARLRWLRDRPRLVNGLLALVLAASAVVTLRDYFGVYAGLPKVATEFESGAVALAREARAFSGDVYVSARLWRDFESIPFMVPASPRVHVAESAADVAPGGDALVLAWPHDPADPPAAYVARLPAGRLLSAHAGPLAQGDLEPEAYTLYVALEAQGAAQPTGGTRFVNGPVLFDAYLEPRGPREVAVVLLWHAPEPVSADYTVYVHLLAGDTYVTGADAAPGAGYLPTGAWRAGELVRDEHLITLEDRDYDPASMTVRVGLYGADGTRLQVLDASGQPAGDGVTVPANR